jgi:hypothetical protein
MRLKEDMDYQPFLQNLVMTASIDSFDPFASHGVELWMNIIISERNDAHNKLLKCEEKQTSASATSEFCTVRLKNHQNPAFCYSDDSCIASGRNILFVNPSTQDQFTITTNTIHKYYEHNIYFVNWIDYNI